MFIKRRNELDNSLILKNVKVVAVGNKTAAVCEENNIKIDISKEFSGEGVVDELSNYDLKGKVIFHSAFSNWKRRTSGRIGRTWCKD